MSLDRGPMEDRIRAFGTVMEDITGYALIGYEVSVLFADKPMMHVDGIDHTTDIHTQVRAMIARLRSDQAHTEMRVKLKVDLAEFDAAFERVSRIMAEGLRQRMVTDMDDGS